MALVPASLILPAWKNLSDKTATFDIQPWDCTLTVEEIAAARKLAKLRRKEWMTKETTVWNIYSTFWGENWFSPVSKDNPPAYMMALAIDYDVPISTGFLEITCQERLKSGGLVPSWFETTLGQRVRAVWTFEVPVPMLSLAFADAFLKKLGGFLEVDQFLPGIDRKSFESEMRWTNGGYWSEVDGGLPVTAEVLRGFAVQLAISMAAQKAPVELDKLQTALLAKFPRFPLFNGGRLEMGKTGLRFWEETADNPNGAMAVDRGFYCVTGEKSLVTWEELLGRGTVGGLQAASFDEVTKGTYFDGTSYYVEQDPRFLATTRPDMLLALDIRGFSRLHAKGETVSAAERILNFVQVNHRVDGAAPLLFQKPGIVFYQNFNVLNISRVRPMAPADKLDAGPDNFPRLWEFFHSVFANSEVCLDHWWAWWQRFYRGAFNLVPVNGQVVFICGPQGCGKNFISELVVPLSMGGSAPNPYRFLMGDTDFSDDILEAPVLAINDEDAPPEYKKSIYEQKLKALAANNEFSYHPKFMKKVRVEWCGRLIVTLNDGPKDLGLLPMLNRNTSDKMDFFLAKTHDFKFGDKYENRELVKLELPFLLRWLLDSYVPPERVAVGGRFGVASYHDPLLMRINRQEQASYNLLELLVAWASPKNWNQGENEWVGTPTDLLQSMTMNETLEQLLRDWSPTKLSKALGDLARAQTPGISFAPEGRGRTYHIRKDGIRSAVQGAQMEEVQTTILS